jgi:tocopherol cyclase
VQLPFSIQRHLNSAIFQGRNKKHSYFEGWYIKQVSDDGQFFFALIPGMAIDKSGKGHAFIQLIEGYSDHTEYFTFDLDRFVFSRNAFEGKIGPNIFGKRGLKVDFNPLGLPFQADLTFSYPELKPTFWVHPALINWYSLIPGFQCYHMLISPFHFVRGKVIANGKEHAFDQGHGYMEKDYGHGFPDDWVWIQCNNFNSDKVSVMFSAGKVLWSGIEFNGFICSLLCEGKTYVFSTYSLARVTHYSLKENLISIEIKSVNYTLKIQAEGSKGGLLRAPIEGAMKRAVYETIHASMKIQFSTRKGKIIYEGTGKQAGFETEGQPEKLFNR